MSTVFIQPWGEAGGSLGSLVQHYLKEVEGSRELQESCEGRPPVMKPRAGLPCVVRSSALEGRSGREVEWYRGEVLEARENCSLVRYVDWGTEEWVQDSQEVGTRPLHKPMMIPLIPGGLLAFLGSLGQNPSEG